MTDKETPVAAILFFQNEAKNIHSQDFIMRNISCEFEISTYNTLCSILRLSSGYNDLLNSENLKVAIAQLCHDIEVCNFTML